MEYQTFNGTSYHKETNEAVIRALESLRYTDIRVRLYYGDIDTGKSWNEEHDVYGKISRSTGVVKIPILIFNSCSIGGPGIFDHCIIRIINSKTHYLIYTHPKFHTGLYTIKQGDMSKQWEVFQDDILQARFSTQSRASRYVQEMRAYI